MSGPCGGANDECDPRLSTAGQRMTRHTLFDLTRTMPHTAAVDDFLQVHGWDHWHGVCLRFSLRVLSPAAILIAFRPRRDRVFAMQRLTMRRLLWFSALACTV